MAHLRIVTRSPRIARAVRTVWRRISQRDRNAIAAIVYWVTANREYETAGLSDVLNQTAAGVYPLFGAARPVQIRCCLPIVRLFSDLALVGIIAHELAHVARIARDGYGFDRPGWERRMRPRHYAAEERAANQLAATWGFQKHLTAMKQERRLHVGPMLTAREHAIVWRLRRRQRRQG